MPHVGTVLLLFVVLQVLNFSVKQCAGSLSTALAVGKLLVDTFSSESVKTADLTAAEELVRGLTFDKYNEKVHCKIMTKIKEADFETVVGRISSRHKIPTDIEEEIADGKYSGGVNQAVVREFKFDKGGPGKVVYGRTITSRREDSTIDLAYVFFELEFKFSPRKIEEQRRKQFLFITYGSEAVVRFEERNLAEKDKEHISSFYRAKALKGFLQEYPALAGTGRDEL